MTRRVSFETSNQSLPFAFLTTVRQQPCTQIESPMLHVAERQAAGGDLGGLQFFDAADGLDDAGEHQSLARMRMSSPMRSSDGFSV